MPNSTYVVDTSVFVADAKPDELYHNDALAFLERVAGEGWPLIEPAIVLAEVAASIARNTGNALLARQIVTGIAQQPHITVVVVDNQLGELAADLAAQQRIRGCDAVYVALAQIYSATLITLDQEQIQRAPLGLIARTPGQELALLPPPSPEE